MEKTINTKELRASMPKIVEGVKKGQRFLVLYRSRPAFRIVPLNDTEKTYPPLSKDPLYTTGALGSSSDGLSAADHDNLLYGQTK